MLGFIMYWIGMEFISKTEFRNLSRARQQQYAERAVFKLIEENPQNGVTLQELRVQTPFSVSTISKYLDVLLAKRQVYRVTRGNVSIYFPNGTPIHEIESFDVDADKKAYKIALIQDNAGKQIYIQEFEIDGVGMKQLAGGIVVPSFVAQAVARAIQKASHNKATLDE